MRRHGLKRSRPAQLVPGTVRVISVRMDYLPEEQAGLAELLDHPSKAYISRYALGRDYHKVLRGKLNVLARRIEDASGAFGYRVFVDSAPVLEKPISQILMSRVSGAQVRRRGASCVQCRRSLARLATTYSGPVRRNPYGKRLCGRAAALLVAHVE